MIRAMVYAGLPEDFQVMAKLGVTTSEYSAIIEAICVALRVDPKALTGKGRQRNLVEARHIAFHLMRKLSGMTVTEIGRVFNRDHSTVIHGINTFDALNEVDMAFQAKVYRVKRLL